MCACAQQTLLASSSIWASTCLRPSPDSYILPTPSCPLSDEHLWLTNVRFEMLLHLCICSDYLRKKYGFPWSEWFVWGKHINQCLMPELLQYKTWKSFLYVLLQNHIFPSSAYIGFFFPSFLLNADLHIYSLSFQCEWFRSFGICILLSK